MPKENMGIWSIVGREIRFRKVGFAIGLICVVAAIGSLVGAITLLDAHDTRTEMILTQREQETREEMDRLEDDYRRIMRGMGHNVMILNEEQSLARLRSMGYPDTTMPEEYAHRLGEGYIETLNHLLPVLEQRIEWPEKDMEVILHATDGQVPISHLTRFLTEDGEAYRNPIIDPISEGAVRLGHSLAHEFGLRPGDTMTFKGEELEIEEIHRPQGDDRDIRVWVSLDKAQEWLGKKDKINVIYALECICDIDELGKIDEEVKNILPDVQVLEFSSRVIARGEARQRAEEEARRAIAAETEHRAQMGEERRAFAAVLVPLVMIASGLWVFFLVLGNVREREAEIGVLRAVGVKESKIMAIFLSKAVIIGIIGAVIGYFAGVIVGAAWGGISLFSQEFIQMFNPVLFFVAIIVAAVLCAVAGWVPALKAANRDPADVLRQE